MEQSAPRAKLRDAFDDFFFKRSTGRAEACFRVGYASVLFIEQLGLSKKLELLFSNAGVHPGTPLDFLYPVWLVKGLFWLWVSAALLLGLGVRTRVAAVSNLVLCIYFFGLRGFAAPHAADWLLHSSAFYLALMSSDARLSVDRRFGWASDLPRSVWALRLAQINWVSVYFTAGLAKLADEAWTTGHAFLDTLRHPLLTHFYPTFAVRVPGLMKAFDWLIIAWELAFPILIATRRLRALALLSALVFNVAIFLTLRIGMFTVLASVGLLLFLDDAPLKKVTLPGEGATLVQPGHLAPGRWVKAFVLAHTSLLMVVSVGHVLLGLRATRLGRVLAGLPIVSYYTRGIAGFAYYDVWNSQFFFKPVRLIYYEATSPDGEPAPIEPFDAGGAFDPGLRYYTEEREGLLSIRLASTPIPLGAWRGYIRYLVDKYRSGHAWPCPTQIRIYRIAAELDRFGSEPTRLGVPKQPLVQATLRCAGREIDMVLSAAPAVHQP